MSRLLFVIVLGLVLDLCSFTVSDSILADSLWKKRVTINYNLFDDNRGKRVGDIVTVEVSESTIIDNDETSSTNNSNKTTGKIDTDRYARGILSALKTGRNARFDARAANTIESEFKNDFSGKGAYDSKRSVDLTLTAMIVEVLDNGNLVLEGKRDVEVNKEKYILKLTGIARPIDITTSNTINSEQMSNVSFDLEGKGWLTRSGQKGWFHRVRDILWPF
ncbi:MAG: flagellar basal body L-ring protein FlgH [Planctomycetota bacterium]|jgi:flagellar L-ring protein precursor FlgH